MVLPATGLFIVMAAARQLGLIVPGRFGVSPAMHTILFVVSAVSALAGPLFIRTLFAHSIKDRQQSGADLFLRFQKRILWLSQTTIYVALVAVFCDFPRFHAAAIVLMALYALYYYFPSQKRIDFDRRIFRVK